MEQQDKPNLLETKDISEIFGKKFFIPDYQRGYRWGTRQVEQFMEDLTSFFKNGKGDFYCLQPIVVKAMSTEDVCRYNLSSYSDGVWYELIDGQQRLTTIRIILALFNKLTPRFKESFTIHYQTRPQLGLFFNSFIYDYDDDPFYITVNEPSKLDIDSWHILQAAQTILTWLKNGKAEEKIKNLFICFQINKIL